MKVQKDIKQIIYKQLQSILNGKIENAQQAIHSAKESRDNETKSSVGDKYETGRAMMQIEQERNEVQLIKAINLKKELAQINIEKKYDSVAPGSLVFTNQGAYFISIGIGKIEINDSIYYAISLASPVGKLLFGKEQHDSINFQGKEIKIEEIF